LQLAPHVVSHVSPDLQATVHWSPHATVQFVTPLHDALQPLPPLEHWTLQLAPPSHPHVEPLHEHDEPVHVGMLAVLPLHARTTPAKTTHGTTSARSKNPFIPIPVLVSVDRVTKIFKARSSRGSSGSGRTRRCNNPTRPYMARRP
jgi:hypothetical protein